MGSNRVQFNLPINAAVTITASAFSPNIQRVTVSKIDVTTSVAATSNDAIFFQGSGEDEAMLLPDGSNQIDWTSYLGLTSRTLFLTFEFSTGGAMQPDVTVHNPGPIIRPQGSRRPTFKQWTVSGQNESGSENDVTVTVVADEFVFPTSPEDDDVARGEAEV
jgi:hypothetical protein